MSNPWDNKSDIPGFTKLMMLQDAVEAMITKNPHLSETVQSIMWEIYHHGQEGGIIQGLLQVAKAMYESDYSREVISRLTGLPEADLSMWEETLKGKDDE